MGKGRVRGTKLSISIVQGKRLECRSQKFQLGAETERPGDVNRT